MQNIYFFKAVFIYASHKTTYTTNSLNYTNLSCLFDMDVQVSRTVQERIALCQFAVYINN